MRRRAYWKASRPFYLQNRIDEQNVYVQDDWRPTDNLILNIGVRDERAGAPQERNHLVDYTYKTTNYVDPRLGFAYTPTWDKKGLNWLTGGPGNFSIRGSFGVYHGASSSRSSRRAARTSASTRRTHTPRAERRLLGLESDVEQLQHRRPAERLDVHAGNLSDDGLLADARRSQAEDAGSAAVEPSFERQVFSSARLRLSYLGTRGANLLQYVYDNLPIPLTTRATLTKIAADTRAPARWTDDQRHVDPQPRRARTRCPSRITRSAIAFLARSSAGRTRRSRRTSSSRTSATAGTTQAQAEFETGYLHGFMGKIDLHVQQVH